MVEIFCEYMVLVFVEWFDVWELVECVQMLLLLVMIYGDDVSYVLIEEGIVNLFLCCIFEECEQVIRGVVGYIVVGLGCDCVMVENLCDRGVICCFDDFGIFVCDVSCDLLVVCLVKDLVCWFGGLYDLFKCFCNW